MHARQVALYDMCLIQDQQLFLLAEARIVQDCIGPCCMCFTVNLSDHTQTRCISLMEHWCKLSYGDAAAAIIGLSGKLEPCVSAAQPSQPPQQQQQANPTKPRTNQQPNVPDQHSADQTDHTPPQPPDRQTGHSSRPTPVQQSQQTTQDSVEQTAASQQEFASQARCHCLCLGLGAGSLPLFLSHHFPGMMVQAVELDPVVIAAATQEMGLPANRYLMLLHVSPTALLQPKLLMVLQMPVSCIQLCYYTHLAIEFSVRLIMV